MSAIILAAGHGSRLRSVAPVKPLVSVRGRPLILHAVDVLAGAGVQTIRVVVGHGAGDVAAALAGLAGVETILSPAWATTPNGSSLLAARDAIRADTVLMMGDHLVSPVLLERLLAAPAAPLLLAVDRRLGHPAVDEADVTKVRTADGRICGIGKDLLVYDAYDTGVFRITPELADALASLPSPGLSDGVRMLARRGRAYAVDVGNAPWLDIDDPRALALAEADWPG
ncbi:MAG: NTP transferase domain-containing protein [Sphingomonadaceae bacterium]